MAERPCCYACHRVSNHVVTCRVGEPSGPVAPEGVVDLGGIGRDDRSAMTPDRVNAQVARKEPEPNTEGSDELSRCHSVVA